MANDVRISRKTFGVSLTEWQNWRWQQRNAVRSIEDLVRIFPRLSFDRRERLRKAVLSRKFQITPYVLTLIELACDGCPKEDDALWRQFFPAEPTPPDSSLSELLSWEVQSELVTPIAQHKYPNRIIVRIANACHSYCQFCFLSHRVLARDSQVGAGDSWNQTLAYIESCEQIREVILSGGDPLLLSNEVLAARLEDLRRISRSLIIRIHTRALTSNPFRVDNSLCKLIRRLDVNTIALHVSHPRELTSAGRKRLRRLARSARLLRAHVPLLHRVNDSFDVLAELFMQLYAEGVSAGYLIHFSPSSPTADFFDTPVRRGAELVRSLRRILPGPAVPEFIVLHPSGKLTVDTAHISSIALDREDGLLLGVNWRGEAVTIPPLFRSQILEHES